MVFNREEAAKRAEASKTNTPGFCQLWTRTMFDAPSVGDVDHDGDADAVDGWKHEKKKHEGDRNPPRGVPVAWSGGRGGFGHRAISLGDGKIRSTDAGGSGVVATVDLDWPEKNWGLTYLGWSEDISGIVIPLPPKPESKAESKAEPKPVPASILLHLMHVSMETFDSPAQHAEDVTKIFTRAKRRKVAWITGTEAFSRKPESLGGILAEQAEPFGYRLFHPSGTDSWVAIRRDLMDRNIDVYFRKIVEGDEEHRDLSVFSVSFDNDDLGPITVFVNHLLKESRPNAEQKNRILMRAIGARATTEGRGTGLVFYGGDQNLDDRTEDTFFGTTFTSVQDELKRYEDTGYGPIDVIATWDPDGRVSAEYVRVLDDSEFHLFGDHYAVEAGVNIKTLHH